MYGRNYKTMSTVDIKIEITELADFLIDSPQHPNIKDWKLFQNYPHDAGFDLRACIKDGLSLRPGGYHLFGTGMKVKLPIGWELQVRPRSGLALKHGITVLNTPGTVDYSYRSEIGVILYNAGKEAFNIYPGDRIAQACIRAVPEVKIEYGKIEETVESEIKESGVDLKAEMAAKLAQKRGGFGSSGV